MHTHMHTHVHTRVHTHMHAAHAQVRTAAFELLRRFPRGKLPGLATAASVAQLVRWALPHLGSPRVCESDAAAFVLRLVWERCAAAAATAPLPRSSPRWHMHMHMHTHCCRYVLQLGWRVTLPPVASGDACSVTVTPEAAVAPTEAARAGAGEGEAAAAVEAAEVVAEVRVAESVELLIAGFKAMLAERMAARPLGGDRSGDPHAAAERAALHGPLGTHYLLLTILLLTTYYLLSHYSLLTGRSVRVACTSNTRSGRAQPQPPPRLPSLTRAPCTAQWRCDCC